MEQLFDQIIEKEKFTEKEAHEVITPVFDALNYCHSLGIVHRDIKPENLLFTSKDPNVAIIKVTDFGLARFIDSETLATTACGTPGYVAPEVLMQKPYDAACDFWSLGVVLFILLSGMPPFYHEDNFELFEKIKQCDYSFKASVWKGVSKEAKDLVSKLLTKEPSERLKGEEIMKHPWIAGGYEAAETPDTNVLEQMRAWNSARKINSFV